MSMNIVAPNVKLFPVGPLTYEVVRITLSGLTEGYVGPDGHVDEYRLATDAGLIMHDLGLGYQEFTVKHEMTVLDNRASHGAQIKMYLENYNPQIDNQILGAAEQLLARFCRPNLGRANVTIGSKLMKVLLQYDFSDG